MVYSMSLKISHQTQVFACLFAFCNEPDVQVFVVQDIAFPVVDIGDPAERATS